MHVLTTGIVTSNNGNDEFEISSEGCTFVVDGVINALPLVGDELVIEGVIEYAPGHIQLDSDYWVKVGDNAPDWPTGTVFTVQGALNAIVGTKVDLNGVVTTYIDSAQGFGNFTFGPDTIRLDFQNGNMPSLGDSVRIVGVVENISPTQKVIDVKFWIHKGDNPPPNPKNIAWDVSEADTMPVGTFAKMYGVVTQWTNQSAGQGMFTDGSSTMNIDFDSSVTNLPSLNDSIHILSGLVDNGTDTVLHTPLWFKAHSGIGIQENLDQSFAINIYPNPAQNYINIETDANIKAIEIFDLTGKVILHKEGYHARLNVSDIIGGVYFLKIEDMNGKVNTQKIVIQ